MSDVSKLDEIKVDAMRLQECTQALLKKCVDFTGFDNKAVTPLQVVEIVRRVFGLEPKNEAKTPTDNGPSANV
jgi:hypothetical protein